LKKYSKTLGCKALLKKYSKTLGCKALLKKYSKTLGCKLCIRVLWYFFEKYGFAALLQKC
jgi:hypothetical protein